MRAVTSKLLVSKGLRDNLESQTNNYSSDALKRTTDFIQSRDFSSIKQYQCFSIHDGFFFLKNVNRNIHV